MDNDKNINVTLMPHENNDDEIVISFETIFRQLKRFFSAWIILAIVVGLVTAGGTMLLNKTVNSNSISALINFNFEGIELGLDPYGDEFDVNKIKSPSMIEEALTELNIPLENVEEVRRNISIRGIMPGEARDKISLYQEIYTKGGTAGLDAVNALLDVGYYPSYYIINFDNNTAGFDIEDGKKIIDEILNSYQEYFFTSYGYNEAFGNSVVAIDYKEYDYPVAIDVFRSILDELDLYVRRIQLNDTTSFRSSKTGFNFEDIRRDIETVRTADIDSLSSYITINNVTNDKEQLVTHYEYKIDELEHELNVSKYQLKSLSDSINSYEKDTMLVFGDVGDTENETTVSQASKKYDELVESKIKVQEEVSTKQQQIEYYKTRIKTLDGSNSKTDAVVEEVQNRLDDLYAKINNLVDIASKTSDEYYENVVFANAFNILVPATGEAPNIEMGGLLMPVMISEAIAFVIYIACAIISAIVNDHRRNKVKKIQK